MPPVWEVALSYTRQMLDPPAHFNVDAHLLAAAIDALDDCAQACNADNAADLSACMRAAASRRASRRARHARTWPNALGPASGACGCRCAAR